MSISHICIHLWQMVQILALNSTHIIPEVPNLISTIVLMLIVIILSFINSSDMVEVCPVHVRKSISHMHIHLRKRYTFHSFLALNSTRIILEVPNLTSTFVLMLIIIILSFINSGDMVEVCSVHARKSISHMHIHLRKRYTFHIFLALNTTHTISEAPNFNSTFNLMQIVRILSFINSGDMVEVCSVHVRKSISHICIYIYGKRYTFHSFLALSSTHINSEAPILISTFVVILIVIILSFINSGDVVEVCSVHVRMSISHICIHLWQMVQISQLFGSQFYTHHP